MNGGCLCGYIRYHVSAAMLEAGYCHCRLCQKSSGAPVLAWATVASSAFAYTSGSPAVFHSSATAQREFCPHCGTQLVFRHSREPDWLDFTVASLDEPAQLPPQYHIWIQSRLAWLHLDDALPQYADSGPDSI